MEKTWEIREKEIREEIAQSIEDAIDKTLPPVDDTEYAVHHAMTWVVNLIRGTI